MPLDFVAASEEHVEIGDVAPLNITGSAITVAAWVKIASATAEKKVIAKWSDSAGAFSYLLGIAGAADDKAQFVVNTGSNGVALGTTSLSVGVWHLIVGTYDGVTVRVYLDEVEDGTVSLTGNISSNTAPVRIGVGSGATSEQPMDGAIDDARIYDRVLSAEEVATIFASNGHDVIVDALQARFTFMEKGPGATAAGADVVDIGPNSLATTSVNTPTYSEGVLAFRRRVA
ncbi:hypothetical protein LCGC14_2086070 [marine sediment metagenome]|uniref:LamG-like jellyroll fold domain-containing protein n=1 Tax=marine sediment metagenome TaxID=412755 RepID=A0A0F9EE30_9ZZZZ